MTTDIQSLCKIDNSVAQDIVKYVKNLARNDMPNDGIWMMIIKSCRKPRRTRIFKCFK